MTSNKLADFLVLVLLLSSIQVLASNTNERWKNFKNAYGWSVDYPADWKLTPEDSRVPADLNNSIEIIETKPKHPDEKGTSSSFSVDLFPGCNQQPNEMSLRGCLARMFAALKVTSETPTKIDRQEALQVTLESIPQQPGEKTTSGKAILVKSQNGGIFVLGINEGSKRNLSGEKWETIPVFNKILTSFHFIKPTRSVAEIFK
jgi:hypothetical protein